MKVYIVQLIKHNRSLRRQTNENLMQILTKNVFAHGKSCMLEIACTHVRILKNIFIVLKNKNMPKDTKSTNNSFSNNELSKVVSITIKAILSLARFVASFKYLYRHDPLHYGLI